MITKYLKIKNHIYTESDSLFIIKGANWGEAGPSLNLYTPQYSSGTNIQGGFDLTTDLGHNIGSYKLCGRTDGTLTWNGKNLSEAAIAAQNIATTGYILYANGLILQWGQTLLTANTGKTITMSINFSSTGKFNVLATLNSSSTSNGGTIITYGGNTIQFGAKSSIDGTIEWFVIGY